MSLSTFAFSAGQPTTQKTILTTTSPTTIVDAQPNRQNVVSITVSNITASPVNVTIDTFDGTTSYNIVTLYSVAARSTAPTVYSQVPSVFTYELPITLEQKWSIRATASAGNSLHVHASGVIIQAGRTSS